MFKEETPTSIFEWNRVTFNNTVERIENRTVLEIAELFLAALNDDREGVIEELSDCAIMLWAVAAGREVDISSLVPIIANVEHKNNEEKMELVRIYAYFINKNYSSYLFNNKHKINIFKIIINHLNVISSVLGIELPEIVDAKMKINRARSWKMVGKDNFQHT